MKAKGLDQTHPDQYRALLKLIKMRLKYDVAGMLAVYRLLFKSCVLLIGIPCMQPRPVLVAKKA